MTQAPPVQYVKTSDGFPIAYAVSGSGTPLLFLPGAFNHVQIAWEYPGLGDWLLALSQRFQLIQMDPRGFGLSGREVGPDLKRWHYQNDIDAVVARLRIERFLIVAVSTGVEQAVQYAVRHPDQVIAVVMGTSAWRWSTALFDLLPAQDWDAFLYSIVPRDRDPEERNRIVELRRRGEDQRNYVLRSSVLYGDPEAFAAEMEALFSELHTPTLVLHPRDYALHTVDHAMHKAQLTGGKLVLIDGTDVWGDAEQGMSAIESFVGALPSEGLLRGAVENRRFHGNRSKSDAKGDLSPRQREVLALIAQGKTNREIAAELVLSERTVQRHIADLYLKIEVRNRAEATAFEMNRLA